MSEYLVWFIFVTNHSSDFVNFRHCEKRWCALDLTILLSHKRHLSSHPCISNKFGVHGQQWYAAIFNLKKLGEIFFIQAARQETVIMPGKLEYAVQHRWLKEKITKTGHCRTNKTRALCGICDVSLNIASMTEIGLKTHVKI